MCNKLMQVFQKYNYMHVMIYKAVTRQVMTLFLPSWKKNTGIWEMIERKVKIIFEKRQRRFSLASCVIYETC